MEPPPVRGVTTGRPLGVQAGSGLGPNEAGGKRHDETSTAR
jgi:hypothetical protein